MGVRLDTDFYDIDDRLYAEEVMSEVHAVWNGRDIIFAERTELDEKVSGQFLDILFSIDPESEEIEERYRYYIDLGTSLKEEGYFVGINLDEDEGMKDLLDRQYGLWRKTKQFWKKNKKVLVIIAVVAVVIASLGAATPGAAGVGALGAGAAGVATAKDPQNESTQKGFPSSIAGSVSPSNHPPFQGLDHFPELFDESYQPLSYNFAQTIPSSQYIAENFGSLKNEILSLYEPPAFVSPPSQALSLFGRTNNPDPLPSAFGFGAKSSNLSEHSLKIGEQALVNGNFGDARSSFEKAIKFNPNNSNAYLDKGITNFGMGNYEEAIQDYHQFAAQKTYPLEYSEFVMGFAKGIPKGLRESVQSFPEAVKGLFVAAWHFSKAPIATCQQVGETFGQLYQISQSEGCGRLSEILVPEIYQLVVEWETLPSKERGERSGTLFAKYGTDLLLPCAIIKGASITAKGIREVNAVIKNFQTAQKTFFLETTAQAELSFAGGFYKMGPLAEDFGVEVKNAATIGPSLKRTALGEGLGAGVRELTLTQQKVVFSSAAQLYDQNLTQLAHAFSKHSGRHPEKWGSLKGPMSTWHDQAVKHLNDIYYGQGEFIQIADPKTGLTWIEKRLQDGRGMRLNQDYTFKGFVD